MSMNLHNMWATIYDFSYAKIPIATKSWKQLKIFSPKRSATSVNNGMMGLNIPVSQKLCLTKALNAQWLWTPRKALHWQRWGLYVSEHVLSEWKITFRKQPTPSSFVSLLTDRWLVKIYKGSLSLLQSDAAVTHTPSGRNENIKVDQNSPGAMQDNIFIKQVTPRYPYYRWKNVV